MIPPVPKDLTEKDAKRIRAWGIQPGPPPEGWQRAGQPRSFNHARVALTGVPHAVHAVMGCGTDVYVPPWVDAALDTPTFATARKPSTQGGRLGVTSIPRACRTCDRTLGASSESFGTRGRMRALHGCAIGSRWLPGQSHGPTLDPCGSFEGGCCGCFRGRTARGTP